MPELFITSPRYILLKCSGCLFYVGFSEYEVDVLHYTYEDEEKTRIICKCSCGNKMNMKLEDNSWLTFSQYQKFKKGVKIEVYGGNNRFTTPMKSNSTSIPLRDTPLWGPSKDGTGNSSLGYRGTSKDTIVEKNTNKTSHNTSYHIKSYTSNHKVSKSDLSRRENNTTYMINTRTRNALKSVTVHGKKFNIWISHSKFGPFTDHLDIEKFLSVGNSTIVENYQYIQPLIGGNKGDNECEFLEKFIPDIYQKVLCRHYDIELEIYDLKEDEEVIEYDLTYLIIYYKQDDEIMKLF